MEHNTIGGDESSRGRRPAFNPDGKSREGGRRPRFIKPQSTDGVSGEHRPRPRFNTYRQEFGANRQQDGERRPRFRTDGSEQRPYNREGGQRKRYNNNPYSQRSTQNIHKRYEDPNKEIRLNKFLANAGICSRREADDFIQAGVITVNGEVVSALGTKVKPTDEVKFHDQPVRRERKVYILLNKPKNCVTTTDDPQERKTVIDIVKNACSERIYPVGRLDRNTTGVLLLTNDGDLAAKLTHPKFGKKKVYAATLDRDLAEEDFAELQSGVILDGEKIVPDAIAFTKEDDRRHIGLEIHSGQNRVVRRMFEKIGYKVMQLDRVSFAGLTKKNVARGKYRFLTPKEVSMLQMGAFE
ncbi:MAG: rRNA pseudouridine synthase [Paludibacteraceae bacterium]|nr:rRNA pseudouridine synthase [Paludibacteraceae bacterium]